MDETVISAFSDVKFIEGMTKMTQRNWQTYFGTLHKTGVYKGLNQIESADNKYYTDRIMDGVVYANGIRAEIETDNGYTFLAPMISGVVDRLICVRVYFTRETCELIEKANLTAVGESAVETNLKILDTFLRLCRDESLFCARNTQYWDIPIYYQSMQGTWYAAGKDMRRLINQDIKPEAITSWDANTVTGMYSTDGRLLITANVNYDFSPLTSTITLYMDTVNFPYGSTITVSKDQYLTAELRVSKNPFTNNFQDRNAEITPCPTNEIPDSRRITLDFADANWTEEDDYYKIVIGAGQKRLFRFTFRGVNYVGYNSGGTEVIDRINYQYFVEQVYSESTVSWGAIGGDVGNQGDLQLILDSKAPIASPTLTGAPKAPTASTSNNSTQIATTAFVKNVLTADKDSPTFTGTPTAPTAELGTSTGQIATTAFVDAAITQMVNNVILYVGDTSQTLNFTTIQDAINFVKYGQKATIILSPNKIYDGFTVDDKNISIQGAPSITINGGISVGFNGALSMHCGFQMYLPDPYGIVVRGGKLYIGDYVGESGGTLRMILNNSGQASGTGYGIAVTNGGNVTVDIPISFELETDKHVNVKSISARSGSTIAINQFSSDRTNGYDIVSDQSIVWYKEYLNPNAPSVQRLNGGQIYMPE